MSLLNPAEIQQHIETDLDTSAIQRLIDAEESEIVRRYGEHAAQIDELVGNAGSGYYGFNAGSAYYGSRIGPGDSGTRLFLSRPALSITTVVERIWSVDTTLTASQYQLRYGGLSLERLSAGIPIPWGHRIVVTYVPKSENAVRKRVLIDLVRLCIQNTGLQREQSGDHLEIAKDYQKEREEILSTLMAGSLPFA